MRRRRWTNADAQLVVAAEAAASSRADFCAEWGLKPARLSRWKSHLLRRPRPKAEAGARSRAKATRQSSPVIRRPALTEIGTLRLHRGPPSVGVEVEGATIRVEVADPSQVRVEWVADLVQRLRSVRG